MGPRLLYNITSGISTDSLVLTLGLASLAAGSFTCIPCLSFRSSVLGYRAQGGGPGDRLACEDSIQGTGVILSDCGELLRIRGRVFDPAIVWHRVPAFLCEPTPDERHDSAKVHLHCRFSRFDGRFLNRSERLVVLAQTRDSERSGWRIIQDRDGHTILLLNQLHPFQSE
ncbi:unnamed protein product [Mycena citricolor]|uniref:Uncharacterized protein n=1 Tax=Mycena citricolor TaxID=2018698 RepID=A0AAD2HNM9_9AGAR|nr:unnamed protein product [Mycena citricolor]